MKAQRWNWTPRMAMANAEFESSAVASQAELAPFAGVDPEELPALLEALLLVSPEPADLRDLAAAAGVAVSAVEDALTRLNDNPSRGWVVIRHRDTVHLSSAPRFAPYVRRFLGLDREARLSGAALETLSFVSYRHQLTLPSFATLRCG